MSDIKQIEARLDRSLRNQIQAPQLDGGFDAAVWARIAKEDAKAAAGAPEAVPSRAIRASRWLAISNALGIATTLGIALFFAMRALSGIGPAFDLDVNLPLPALDEATVAHTLGILGQVLGYAALAFGLSFTSFGRRLRASFS